MKKMFILFCICLIPVSCFASEIASIFELNALYEIQNGKITKTSGKYTHIYSIEQNTICRLSSENEHYKDLKNQQKTCFNFLYVPTMSNSGYFLVFDKGTRTNAIMQFASDFKSMTLYQFNGLDTHCTVWYGKIK